MGKQLDKKLRWLSKKKKIVKMMYFRDQNLRKETYEKNLGYTDMIIC